MKLFPSYFNVCKHISVDFENIEHPGKPLKLIVVDEECENITGTLGINNQRRDHLLKCVKKALVDNTDRIKVLQSLEPEINHINEFYMCVLMSEKEAHGNVQGLMQMLGAWSGKGRPPGAGE